MITCRAGGSFNPDFCQPYVNCNQAVGDSTYTPPQNSSSPQWNFSDYTMRCDCPANRYSFECAHVNPGQCNTSLGEVWEGNYVNPSWYRTDETRDNMKEAICFLKPCELGLYTHN
jgi:hypothetical protein